MRIAIAHQIFEIILLNLGEKHSKQSSKERRN